MFHVCARVQLRILTKEKEAAVDQKNTELRRADENLVRLRKESERQASKYKLLSTGTSSQKEEELQKEVDKCMVRACIGILLFSCGLLIFFGWVASVEVLYVQDGYAELCDHQMHAL